MNPIDAVISWVDGYDPIYQEKLKAFCAEQGIEKDLAVEPTRIQQHNEIHYCLRSLERFAPWLRKVYIITNQQTPPALTQFEGTTFGNKIQIIDQNDLLLENNAPPPVFNSLSIEWLMWRIKDLSNHFLYLNDDFFITQPVIPEDFFQDNKIVLRGDWKVHSDRKWSYRLKKHLFSRLTNKPVKPKTNPHRCWQEQAAKLAGWQNSFYLLPHAPFPLIKKTFDDAITDNSELFDKNVRYPFRHPQQISSTPLMVHLDIKEGRTVYDGRKKVVMVNGASHSLKKIKSRLKHARNNHRVAFLCMQSIDQAPPATQQYMMDWLNEVIVA